MKWEKAEMPDEALDPNSLVGRIRNTERINNATWDSPMSVEMIGGWITDNQGEPIAEISFGGDQPQLLPLWMVMTVASGQMLDSTFGDATSMQCWAAEIEALRDWLLPEEHEPPMVRCSDPTADELVPRELWRDRQRLRALLTEQARIARGES